MGFAGFEVARCYTIGRGIVTPGAIVSSELSVPCATTPFIEGQPGDRKEIRRLQAGAADQRAVDIGNRHQFRRVRGFDRAAIEDPHPGALPLKSGRQGIPDKPMNLLDISSGRGQPGADRPDRLISHDQIGRRRAIRAANP